MLTVAEDAAADPAVPERSRRSLIDEHARQCKAESFELHSEINELLNSMVAQDLSSFAVDVDTLRRWKAKAKQFNKSFKLHLKAILEDKYRACAEECMLKFAMKGDILDREAAFTEALEIVSGRENASELNEQAIRAMRFARMVNSGTSEMTTPETFDATVILKCLSICDDEDLTGS